MRQMEQWLHINGVPSSEPSVLQVASGMPVFAAPTMPDVILQGGETISAGVFNFQVLWTPGHSPGHICLYEPAQKILFSGDHILPIISPAIRLQTEFDISPLGDFINSLNKVKQLDVNLVLPAHEHIFTNLAARVDELIQHHEMRNSEILAAMKTEPKTAYQISAEITWIPQLGGVSFRDLAPMDKRGAVMETLAHLEAMRFSGKVDKLHRNSTIYYQSA